MPNVIFVPGYLMLRLYAFSQVCLTSYAFVRVIYLELSFFFFFFFFFFRFSITMQEKLHLFFYSASGLFFLFSFLSFFLFFFFFFFFKGHDHWSQCSSVPDGRKYTGWQSSLKSFSKLWAKFISKAKAPLKRRRYALGYGHLCSILKFPLHTHPPPPPPLRPPPLTPESLLALIRARCCKVTQVIHPRPS